MSDSLSQIRQDSKSYEWLPFRFDRLRHGGVAVTNMIGEWLKLSESDINAYTQGLIGKTMTLEQIKENMRMDAENLYPSLAKQLAAGRTITQATATYKALAAATLGVDPETIDFSDSNKWGKLLSYVDPNTNEARLMTNSEWSRFVRGQPEYMETDEAIQKTIRKQYVEKLLGFHSSL